MKSGYATAACFGASYYSAPAVLSRFRPWQIMPMRYPLNLKQHRKARGWTQDDLGERMGVDQSTVQRWENGRRTPDLKDINAMASAFGVDPGELFGVPNQVPLGPRIYIKGEVGAGLWREAVELPEEDWQVFHGSSHVSAPLEQRFGLRVVGESMNELYPHGTILECVSFLSGVDIESGKRVIVLRTRADGDVEATVKELRIESDGTKWLVPRSTNPAFQVPIRIDREEPGIIETSIIAVVVGSFRQE